MVDFKNTSAVLRSVAAILGVAFSASGAMAENENVLVFSGALSNNNLIIHQSQSGGHNSSLHVAEENSLLVSDDWMWPLTSLLGPGTITQIGDSHILTASVSGRHNQLSVLQTGTRNKAAILSSGQSNMVSALQRGSRNYAAVVQAGMRNSVAIFQR